MIKAIPSKYFLIASILIIPFGLFSFLFWGTKVKSFIDESREPIQVSKKQIKIPENFSEEKSVSILFAGDLMVDRYIRTVVSSKGDDYVFEGVKDVMQNADLVVANLEGPITKNESISIGTEIGERNNYKFTFDERAVDILKKYNIRAVNIGNNHILDFGLDGAKQTQNCLEKGGVGYFGQFNGNTVSSSNILKLGDFRIGFVGYNQFAKDAKNKTLEDISGLKERADIIIVFTHWGVEYESGARPKEKALAHEFVDNGADLIIGTHPHVIQETEEYKGKRIYYSLGNFVFDQYFSSETEKGMLVMAKLSKGGGGSAISFQNIAIKLQKNGKTEAQ